MLLVCLSLNDTSGVSPATGCEREAQRVLNWRYPSRGTTLAWSRRSSNVAGRYGDGRREQGVVPKGAAVR